jgi:DNA-binding NtrC family response regulator
MFTVFVAKKMSGASYSGSKCLQETALIVTSLSSEREAIQRFFVERDYHVLAARTSDEAIELCRDYEGAIHILVTDVDLCGASGWKLAESVTKVRPGIVVLFLSAACMHSTALLEVTKALSHKTRAQTHLN